ncbi:MAG: hypothetical protein V3R80_13515, partial [Candidatus Tectomicrobia bacterium]
MHGADLTKEQLLAENVALRQRMLELELAAARTTPGQTEEVRQRREETWQQAETIGTMGGSRVHDFNNILASILGYTELAQHN